MLDLQKAVLFYFQDCWRKEQQDSTTWVTRVSWIQPSNVWATRNHWPSTSAPNSFFTSWTKPTLSVWKACWQNDMATLWPIFGMVFTEVSHLLNWGWVIYVQCVRELYGSLVCPWSNGYQCKMQIPRRGFRCACARLQMLTLANLKPQPKWWPPPSNVLLRRSPSSIWNTIIHNWKRINTTFPFLSFPFLYDSNHLLFITIMCLQFITIMNNRDLYYHFVDFRFR